MIVVKPCTVREHQIAFHLVKRERPMRIEARKLIFFSVLGQSGHAEAPRILMWIFSGIIPSALERAHEIRSHQLHGLHDRIDLVAVMPCDAVLRFDAV
jgi:hypothetical protein